MTGRAISLKMTSDVLDASAPTALGRILVALDASDHANRALDEALRLAATAKGTITGIHAYAAALHDRRFRQMEGGLPARYHDETEMMHQRDVHDDLIGRGLGIISDSYHDVAAKACDAAGRPYKRLSPEGKNYRRILEATSSGEFDLLAMGARGLGSVPGGQLGSVCERLARRSPIDLLVIKDAGRAIGDGPIVVALDGSQQSWGALMTALDLGRRLGVPVHAIAAYDPYYHYVAFNKIAGVLSEEAGQVFRFKEQERLHEELIDEGIAKIYDAHLSVARTIAADAEQEITCKLLDGKPYKAILGYLDNVGASLLMLGKIGIHADDGLDIGSNAEALLRLANCHVWLGQTSYTPPMDVVAEKTIAWSDGAQEMLSKAPAFAQEIARKALLRLAHERGHTFITTDLVAEVAQKLMPGRKEAAAAAEEKLSWEAEATALLLEITDETVMSNVKLRAEKAARREGVAQVRAGHVRPFLDSVPGPSVAWDAEALAMLARVPEAVRGHVRQRLELLAAERGAKRVCRLIVEEGMGEAKKAMHGAMHAGGHRRLSDE